VVGLFSGISFVLLLIGLGWGFRCDEDLFKRSRHLLRAFAMLAITMGTFLAHTHHLLSEQLKLPLPSREVLKASILAKIGDYVN
jgi:hypothetical protein